MFLNSHAPTLTSGDFVEAGPRQCVCVCVCTYICACTCMCVYMYMCVCTCVYRSGNNLRCWPLPQVFETVSLVVCNCMPRLVGMEDLGVSCLYFLYYYRKTRIVDVYYHICLYVATEIWAQILVFIQQVLYEPSLWPRDQKFLQMQQFNQQASAETSCTMITHETSLPSMETRHGSHFGFFLVFWYLHIQNKNCY